MTQIPVEFGDAQNDARNWYVHLHEHLSQLHEFLAQQAIPHSYSAEGCAEVQAVLQLIEKIVDELPKPKTP